MIEIKCLRLKLAHPASLNLIVRRHVQRATLALAQIVALRFCTGVAGHTY
jgi:hypothetical protein